MPLGIPEGVMAVMSSSQDRRGDRQAKSRGEGPARVRPRRGGLVAAPSAWGKPNPSSKPPSEVGPTKLPKTLESPGQKRFGNLHGIERGSLAQIIADDEEAQTAPIRNRRIVTNPTNEANISTGHI